MERVERAHRQSALPVRSGVAPLPAALEEGPLLSSVLRHNLQHEGIVEQMRHGGLLSPRLVYVDFGAGDGGLCRCVECAAAGGRFLLVDRSRKPNMPAGVEVDWLCADVSTLHASELQRAATGECVVVSNHLCGQALDLAVQSSMLAFHLDSPAPRLLGVMAATCCHDQCAWDSFLGQRAFVEWGFMDQADFAVICAWSRMAPRRGKADHTRERVVREAARLGVTPAEAAQLGLHCRRLMDTARLLHLQQHGFSVSLCEHVDFRVTADNVMLCAVRRPGGNSRV